jgi:competence protein ComEC
VLGIGAAIYFQPQSIFPLIVASLAGYLLLFFLWMKYVSLKLYLNKWIPGMLAYILLVLVGYIITCFQTEKINRSHFSTAPSKGLVVTVSSEPKRTGDILRFETEVNQALRHSKFYPQKGKLLIALKTNSIKFSLDYGDRLLVPYSFKEVEPPYNPFEFNYKKYLSNHGIYHQAFINQSQVRLLQRGGGNPVISVAQKMRQKMVKGYEKFIPGKDAVALASVLILGSRADLEAEIISAYSKTGTMHVLSVSGMHVALVFGLLAFLLGFSRQKTKFKVFKACLIISLIGFYSLLSGFSPSVCRAALMISMLILAKTINRRTNSYNVLAASALLLLLYNPYFLVDAGFQLSYLAVLGLIYLYPKIYNFYYFKNWFLDQVWGYTALSIAAQLATAPLSIYYFHQFPTYFLISNLSIVLPIAAIMYGGIVFLLAYAFSGTSAWFFYILKILGYCLGESIDWVNRSLIYIEHLPFASITFYHYSPWYYVAVFVAGLLLLLAIQYSQKQLLYFSCIMAFFLAAYTSYELLQRQYRDSIVFYSLRRNVAIGFFEGSRAYIYSDMKQGDKAFQFSVTPSLSALSNEVSFVNNLNNSADNQLCKKGNCLQFQNWKLLIWDSSFNKFSFKVPLNTDAVLLSGNPKITLASLLKNVKCKTILIDATNKGYRIRRWQEEATQLHLKIYILKRNMAYIINKLN